MGKDEGFGTLEMHQFCEMDQTRPEVESSVVERCSQRLVLEAGDEKAKTEHLRARQVGLVPGRLTACLLNSFWGHCNTSRPQPR